MLAEKKFNDGEFAESGTSVEEDLDIPDLLSTSGPVGFVVQFWNQIESEQCHANVMCRN